MKRIKSISWWRWLVAAVPVAAIVYVSLNESLATVIAIVAAIAAVVVVIWNPFAARPRPHLLLRPSGAEAVTNVALGDHWRPVDIDAVVDTAEQIARPSSMGALRWLGGFAAKPTDSDLATFRSEVDEYLVEMRTWAEAAAEWLATHASVLDCHVFQENDSAVDAEDAKVTVVFPEGTEVCDAEDLEPPDEPQRPMLKTGPGPLMEMLRPWGGVPSFVADGPALDFSMREVEPFSVDEPDVDEGLDGSIEVSYRRQAIRHRESLPSGDPFTVRLPPGRHEVFWRVTAKNLPHPKTGTWVISCPVEASGTPITDLASFQSALAGEPELDIEALFASKREDPDTGQEAQG